MSTLKKYPSPNDSKRFKKYWDKYIDMVVSRDNFEDGHLYQLEMLCDVHVDYELLQESIEMTGMVTEDGSRMRPEIAQINQARREIREYLKLLGLQLQKDKLPGRGGKRPTSSDWE